MPSNNFRPGPCGVVCATCVHLAGGCEGCRRGGGDADCFIRQCTAQKGIRGCWLCDQFPCRQIRDMDLAWRGVNIAFIEMIREMGEEDFSARALQRIGRHADHAALRFKSVDEIKNLLR